MPTDKKVKDSNLYLVCPTLTRSLRANYSNSALTLFNIGSDLIKRASLAELDALNWSYQNHPTYSRTLTICISLRYNEGIQALRKWTRNGHLSSRDHQAFETRIRQYEHHFRLLDDMKVPFSRVVSMSNFTLYLSCLFI